MKVHKLTVMVIDFDFLGGDDVKFTLENANYPNDCINPQVMEIESYEIGEWEDENPLNLRDVNIEEFNKIVKEEGYTKE